jgi:hypothetical protein
MPFVQLQHKILRLTKAVIIFLGTGERTVGKEVKVCIDQQMD